MAATNSSTRGSLLLCCFLWGTGFRGLYLSPRIGAPASGARCASSADELRAELADRQTRPEMLARIDALLRARFLECWLKFALARTDLAEVAEQIRQDDRPAKAARWCRIAKLV